VERWLRSGLWWIPLLFAVLVAGVGGYTYRTLADAMRAKLGEDLRTLLAAEVAAVELWVARTAAADPEIREATAELVDVARRALSAEALRRALAASPATEQVLEALVPLAREQGYPAWALLSPDRTTLAASVPTVVGRRLKADSGRLDAVLEGATTISRPLAQQLESDEPQAVMRVAAAVRDAGDEPIAVLAFEIPARGFSDVLRIARAGESGETYAFDRDGVMMSHSRFESQIAELGLLEPGQPSILTIEVRDPGGNLVNGFTPTLPLRARPLTRMAASAVSGESGTDIDGYPDYRGVPVVGAWTWLPDLGMGMTTEIDLAEAYAGLTTVQRAFGLLAGVLSIAALGLLGYSLVLGRVQGQYEKARKLGRYRITEKIGEGGMGVVYRAEHAMLRRPTAVKLLEPGRASEEAIVRFEREVQTAASLTHPNTIAIYDYGRTPDEVFYYAMEYLEGITVDQLVRTDGPQPEERAVYLMRQATASVAEAHAADLIHRDLKPSNIMLCRRGGALDFVKVLDFGLVRAREEELELTSAESLTGTPLYLSPEALEDPEGMDARSDVYQLGAVLYFLLVGRPVFEGKTLVEILAQSLHNQPVPPSEAVGRTISPDLEKLVLACLAKDREGRPANASELLAALEALRGDLVWTQADALAWWEEWSREHPDFDASISASGSLPSGWQVDVGGRFRGSGSGTIS
jgi:hypothetical protein